MNAFSGSDEAERRPAEGKGIAEALAVADGDIHPHFARGLEHAEGHRIDRGDQQRPLGMNLVGQGGEIIDAAEKVGVLHQHAGNAVVQETA